MEHPPFSAHVAILTYFDIRDYRKYRNGSYFLPTVYVNHRLSSQFQIRKLDFSPRAKGRGSVIVFSCFNGMELWLYVTVEIKLQIWLDCFNLRP